MLPRKITSFFRNTVRLVPIALAIALSIPACAAAPATPPPAPTAQAAPQVTVPKVTQRPAPSAANTTAPLSVKTPVPTLAPAIAAAQTGIAPTWMPLLQRLEADGLGGPDTRRLFAHLGDNFSAAPMGTKITELFKNKFMRTPPDPTKPRLPVTRIYPNVVIAANIAKTLTFLQSNSAAFDFEEKTFGVPRNIVASLLMVETRLGNYLGKDNALWSLACMSAATKPEQVMPALSALPITSEHQDWLKERLKSRSDWAYVELKALIRYGKEHKIDLLSIPGSVYGAIGICQFMPSNLIPYGADGDGDGKIDLFNPADAIASVGNYLKGHGWKPTSTRAHQHAMIMRYNKSTRYANTILALADALDPDAKPPVKGKGTKAAGKKITPSKKKAVPAKAKPQPAKKKIAPAAKPQTKPVKRPA